MVDGFRENGAKRDGFCLAWFHGTGYKRASAGLRDPFRGSAAKTIHFRKIRRRYHEERRKFLDGTWRFGFRALLRARPVSRLFHGLPTASRETGNQGCVLFCFPVHRSEFFAEIREENRCETQRKRKNEDVVDGGAGGAFAGGLAPVTGRKTACAPGREKNGGPT